MNEVYRLQSLNSLSDKNEKVSSIIKNSLVLQIPRNLRLGSSRPMKKQHELLKLPLTILCCNFWSLTSIDYQGSCSQIFYSKILLLTQVPSNGHPNQNISVNCVPKYNLKNNYRYSVQSDTHNTTPNTIPKTTSSGN